MHQYRDLLTTVINHGHLHNNRTGIPTIRLNGYMMKFNLSEGFPVLTLRKTPWKAPIGEMIGFINGYDNAKKFRELKCKFWDANANEHGEKRNAWLDNANRKGQDDLGRIYGAQWRRFASSTGGYVDQFFNAINDIINNPESRRIIVSSWRPDEFNQMALPPCHVMYQFFVNTDQGTLDMKMDMRSNDLFLGTPANIIEYAFLLEAISHATGYKAGQLIYTIGDAHIYDNSKEAIKLMLDRDDRPLPKLMFNKPFTGDKTKAADIVLWLEHLHPDDFELAGYNPHEAISGVEMAV